MKRVAFLISGGDAPGINACLYGIAAAAQRHGLECMAVPCGFDGLIDGSFENWSSPYAGGHCYGGSLVPTARSKRFRERQWQLRAVEQVHEAGIDGIVVLGGEGSAKGASQLVEFGVPCICVPVTIDNDLWGTDYSLGFDSGVQQIRDVLLGVQETAQAYRGRVFMVETLGGPAGHLALAGGLAGGADLILVPELRPTSTAVAARVKSLLEQGREWVVIAACEGLFETYKPGDQGIAFVYGKEIERVTGVRTRVTVMGYYMRGGAPTAFDSLLGQMMGAKAVELLREDKAGQMVVFRENRLASVDLACVVGKRRELNADQVSLARLRDCLVP